MTTAAEPGYGRGPEVPRPLPGVDENNQRTTTVTGFPPA
jgi:hypothetical protein